eukprot:scaffold6522_cov44-Phaeocystis_antarctica.AAC.1
MPADSAAAGVRASLYRGMRASTVEPRLNGQRRENRRLWRRLARAPEAVPGRPVGRASPWERRASQGCQARPEEAREPAEPRAMPREHFGHAVPPQPDVTGERVEARVAVDDLVRVRARVRGWVRVEVKVRVRVRVRVGARVRVRVEVRVRARNRARVRVRARA